MSENYSKTVTEHCMYIGKIKFFSVFNMKPNPVWVPEKRFIVYTIVYPVSPPNLEVELATSHSVMLLDAIMQAFQDRRNI